MSNSYDPNSFYSQNTSSWQSTTNKSNFFYQSGQLNGQPPSPRKKKNAWGWYKRQKTITKIGVACGLALAFFLWASIVSAFAVGFVQATDQSSAPTTIAQAPKMSPTSVESRRLCREIYEASFVFVLGDRLLL